MDLRSEEPATRHEGSFEGFSGRDADRKAGI